YLVSMSMAATDGNVSFCASSCSYAIDSPATDSSSEPRAEPRARPPADSAAEPWVRREDIFPLQAQAAPPVESLLLSFAKARKTLCCLPQIQRRSPSKIRLSRLGSCCVLAYQPPR